jgi:hypothetical protein
MLSGDAAAPFVSVRARAARPLARRGGWADFAPSLALALIAAPLPYLLRFDQGHYVTALLLALTLTACVFYDARGGILATLLYLAVLGDYRRYAGFFQGYPGNDPLLLVAPAIAVILIGQALLGSQRAGPSTLSRLVLALMAFMFIEMFNPSQGDLTIGFAGALFYLAPLLWFWVGRAYGSTQFAGRTVALIIAVGTAAMLLGLYQTYFGLLPFEQQWVEQVGYEALHISDDVVRAIGFFSSSAEYQRYLLVSAVVVFSLWMTRRSRTILLLPLFLAAIFLSAARGPVIMVMGAIVIVWALSARRAVAWLPRLGLAAVLGGVALLGLLVFLQGSSLGGRVAPLVDRQVSGLLDPGNEEKSTASGHLQMLRDGLLTGVTAPAGLGLGATTGAAQKYGAHNLSAEIDIANVMISMGVLGGILYFAIMVCILAKAVGWWRAGRDPYALALVGVLFGTFGGWLIGGEYSVAALLWFQVGMMDRLSMPKRGRAAAVAA